MTWALVLLCATACAIQMSQSSLLTATIIEPQLSLLLIDSLLNARAHLKREYPIVLLTLPENWPFFEQSIWRLLNVKLMRNETVPTDRQQYSDMLVGCSFWQQFTSAYVLIFQADSRFCTGSPYNIEQFMLMNYPYLGAPWKASGGVGNGGFSLRLLSATRDACNDSARGYKEDDYFWRYFKANSVRWPNAPRTTAELFASETYYAANQTSAPLGIHKAHAYQKDGRLQKVCAEVELLAQRMQAKKMTSTNVAVQNEATTKKKQ